MSEVADSTEARSQSLIKPALFTEHSNTDKMKKRRTVADSVANIAVANIGESGDRDRCLGTSVAYLGVKPALFTEHSNTDRMKRRTVADSVDNIGENGDRDRCLGTSVAYLGVNTRP